jgi:DNA modification methylase
MPERIESQNYRLFDKHLEDNDLREGIKRLSDLPYKQGDYESRHWGHNRHSLCSYPSKLTPSIPYHLVDIFTNEGDSILDPMSGVGTIPFEASLNGRQGIGVDLSPLAYTVTRAKLKSYDPMEVRFALRDLKQFIQKNRAQYDIEGVEEEIQEFFHNKTLREILAARDFFEDKEEDRYYLLKACTSHILHGNRPYALSRRSHNVIPIPPKGDFEYKPLLDSLSDKVERTLKYNPPSEFVEGEAYRGDAFDIVDLVGSVDAIITSPPFLKTTEFLRQNRVRLWFNGWEYDKQDQMKQDFLENKQMESYIDLLSPFNRCLGPGSLCVLHTGVVNGEDMALNIAEVATDYGFAPLGIVYENTEAMESQGRTDRGSTKEHQFLVLKRQ